MRSYVSVSRDAIVARLEAAGFSREDVRGEVTYIRRHDRDASYAVRVYTSIPEFGTVSRDSGKDAIRIVASNEWYQAPHNIKRWKTHYKARVNRVGTSEAVLARTMEKARAAWKACNIAIRERAELRKQSISLLIDKRIYKAGASCI